MDKPTLEELAKEFNISLEIGGGGYSFQIPKVSIQHYKLVPDTTKLFEITKLESPMYREEARKKIVGKRFLGYLENDSLGHLKVNLTEADVVLLGIRRDEPLTVTIVE